MDNLTHTLTGLAVARMGLDRRVEGAALTLALANNLPDLDIVTGAFGRVTYLEHHRAISHALPASPFLAAALAVVLARWPGSKRRFGPTFLVAWFGILLHIVWDLWTSYGTRILLPFDAGWYSLDWMFIVDPLFLLLLVVASFAGRKTGTLRAARVAFALAIGYIGVRAVAHEMAEGQAVSLAGSDYTTVRALPDPLNLNRWRFLASSDTHFATGYVPAYGTSRTKVSFPRVVPDAAALRAARESRAARVFLDFSAFPRYERRQQGDVTIHIWQDLRFLDRRADGFLCEVRVDPSGRVLEDRVVF